MELIEPKISIVTVSYNAEATIEETILSVLRQTYRRIEYVIVDGASTDHTMDIVKKYKNNIKILSEPDKGIYDAMNKAIRLVTGDFLLFLGADDVLASSYVIGDVCKQLKDQNIIYYGNVRIKKTGKIFNGKYNKYKWAIWNISHQSIFYPKHIYKEYFYDLKYNVYADYAYNLILLKNKEHFEYINIIISIYNTDGYSSYTRDVKFAKDKIRLINEAVGVLPAILVYLYGIYFRFMRNIIRDKLSL